MDGIDAARTLGGRPRTAGIPLVALSSSLLEGGGEWLLAAGFAGYLEKPISVRDFADQVRRYCGWGKLDRARRHDEPPGTLDPRHALPGGAAQRTRPRLHLAAVIISLQVLGQVAFDFPALDRADPDLGRDVRGARGRDRPPAAASVRLAASALLTGNGVAFILRVPGTERGLVEHERLVDLRGHCRSGVAPLQVPDPLPGRPRLQSVELRARPPASCCWGPIAPIRWTSGGARCRRPSPSRWRSSSSGASRSSRDSGSSRWRSRSGSSS